ncbi:hypothetical protein OG943_16910 [Amycolatopsis sp. NBC_00345]|uniref:hypothetical protein n=1 Tax=Amycolatopsis sp. NBC_00345 TaxID=2975955 RepID=UPI002E263D25
MSDDSIEDVLRRLTPQVLGALVQRYGRFDPGGRPGRLAADRRPLPDAARAACTRAARLATNLHHVRDLNTRASRLPT